MVVGELVVIRLPHDLVQENLLGPVCLDEPVTFMMGVAGCSIGSWERRLHLFQKKIQLVFSS